VALLSIKAEMKSSFSPRILFFNVKAQRGEFFRTCLFYSVCLRIFCLIILLLQILARNKIQLAHFQEENPPEGTEETPLSAAAEVAEDAATVPDNQAVEEGPAEAPVEKEERQTAGADIDDSKPPGDD
jgi:hypothetical protein